MSMIEMKDVVKKYDNGTTALRGVSIRIEPGEFAYIVGPSGAGKSTFIRLLYREIKIDKGNLAVAGFIWLVLSTRFAPSRMSYQGENSSGLRLRVPLSTILRS